MKKYFLILAVAVLSANYAHSQFKFGVRAGGILSNFIEKDSDGDSPEGEYKSKLKPGFQVGIVGEFSLSENFAIQPALIYITNGAKYKYSETWYDDKLEYEGSMSINYLQLPINALYKIDLGKINLLLQAGPYLGYATSGKMKYEYKENGKVETTYDEKLEIGNDKEKDFVKPLDIGVGLGIGIQSGAIQAVLGFNQGFTNISHRFDNDDKSTVKNQNFALTLTYLF